MAPSTQAIRTTPYRRLVGLTWLVAATTASCVGGIGIDVSDTGGTQGSGGAQGTGGVTTTGSGGRATGSGGTMAGSGGTTGTGGTTTGTGGSATGTGGSTTATGGAVAGTGGAASGGRVGTGGSPAGTGGAAIGGRVGTGGAATGGRGGGGAGGRGGFVGSSTGGATSTGGSTGASALCVWPTAVGSPQPVTATINVSGTYDGGMKRFVGSGALGASGQVEGGDPLFEIANGGTLQNVIIGNPAADGVHCGGTCTLKNVWWEDVGEDAATSRGGSSIVMTIDGGGAKGAADKVFQHNGGGTMVIKNFCAQDFGKLYRSCGNCSSQSQRNVQFENVMIIPRAGALAGVNANYNDTATFKMITIKAAANSVPICDRYTGNSTGAEPTKSGSGPDGTVCKYAASDITWAP